MALLDLFRGELTPEIARLPSTSQDGHPPLQFVDDHAGLRKFLVLGAHHLGWPYIPRYGGFHSHGGPQKWMVSKGTPENKMDDDWGTPF